MQHQRVHKLVAGALATSACLLPGAVVDAGDGVTRSSWPAPDDPGMPFYARVEMFPPYVFHDDGWAAIVFYRDPSCVPLDFNLIDVFDVPTAFGCSHTVRGTSIWAGEPFVGAPRQVEITGDDVPVWFVPWSAVEERARAGGVLTMRDLLAIENRRTGRADRYHEIIHPHPAPVGGHPVPGLVLDAEGELDDDGSPFRFHLVWIGDEVRAVDVTLG